MLPLNNSQIQANFNQAVQLIGQRKLDEAENRLRIVLSNMPKSAGAHFHMARIQMMRADAEKAIQHLEIARATKPDGENIWRAYAEVLANLDDADRTEAFLNEAKAARLPAPLMIALQDRLKKQPAPRKGPSIGDASPADIQRGIDLVSQGKAQEAESLARGLRRQHPDVGIIALILANALGMQNKYAEARKEYEAAVRLAPDYPEARNTFGNFLVETGDYEQAEKEFQAALKLRKDMPQALLNSASLLGRMGRYPLAIEYAKRALKVQPDLLDAYMLLNRLYSIVAKEDEAINVLNEALEKGMKNALIHARLGNSYGKQGREQDAMAAFDEAIELDENLSIAYSFRALYLQSLARFEEAEADFRKALALQPEGGEIYRSFFTSHKLKLDDPVILQLEDQIENTRTTDGNKMQMYFAMAKAVEQNKAYDRVFDYLNPANDLVRKLFPYDISTRRKEIDKVKAAFADVDFSQVKPIEGASDFAPIFVTGMPRSGTTLVEQILSSHSRVDGAGENGAFIGNLTAMMNQGTPNYRPLDIIGVDELRGVGEIAEKSLQDACPGAERVVDKAIQTYMAMGVVKMIFPKAHIVLVRRDPRDCLLSIYKNVFPEGTHRYAYNQTDLGKYYRMFVEMVEFWREKLPGGFHEIQYEDLIDSPEEETRKLLEACDLEWEDACLSFHENKRRVATLSVAQVRQPIYKSSQAAWKRHEDDLAEMIEALGDVI